MVDPELGELVRHRGAWRGELERRLHLLDPLRRRLRTVPLGLVHPYWIDDRDFNLDYHVRHTAVAPPGHDEDADENCENAEHGSLHRAPPC